MVAFCWPVTHDNGAVRLDNVADCAHRITEIFSVIFLVATAKQGNHFEASKGLADETHFLGLAIDEDRQPELTSQRVDQWVKQIFDELQLKEIIEA